jgi:hypothetical protein
MTMGLLSSPCDSSLLAVLQDRTNEQMITIELQRSITQNRETTVNIGGKHIMLLIPITFDLTAINTLRTADDLYKLRSCWFQEPTALINAT